AHQQDLPRLDVGADRAVGGVVRAVKDRAPGKQIAKDGRQVHRLTVTSSMKRRHDAPVLPIRPNRPRRDKNYWTKQENSGQWQPPIVRGDAQLFTLHFSPAANPSPILPLELQPWTRFNE